MRQNQLILLSEELLTIEVTSCLSNTLTESLWDTVKNSALHIILREPALLELAKRKDPGVIAYCDVLLFSEDQESWFSALKTLKTLDTYDSAQRLLVLCGTSNTIDRRIVLNVLARILTSSQREGFRRILRSMIEPGDLDVTGWSPIALRVLESTCAEKGIEIVDTEGLPLTNLEAQLAVPLKREAF